MLWAWAAANAHFEAAAVPFAECFPETQRRSLPHSGDLFAAARLLTGLSLAALAACASLCGSRSLLAPLLVPPALYAGLVLLLLAPLGALPRPGRALLLRTLLRVLLPLHAVSWADFLLADMLTSLAKSSSDLSRSVCLMLHGPLVQPSHPASPAATAACGPLTPVSLVALTLPFLLRLAQCLSVWQAGGPRSQLLNALKYASSLPALLLTAVEHEYHVHRRPFPWHWLWLAVMVANSLYSCYWDIEQDWDMPWLMAGHAGGKAGRPLAGCSWLPRLQPTHRYSGAWYTWLVASNLALRFAWAHRLLGDLEAHNTVLLAVAALEVARRAQWLYARVETELRRQGLLLPREPPAASQPLPLVQSGGSQASLQLATLGSLRSVSSFGSLRSQASVLLPSEPASPGPHPGSTLVHHAHHAAHRLSSASGGGAELLPSTPARASEGGLKAS